MKACSYYCQVKQKTTFSSMQAKDPFNAVKDALAKNVNIDVANKDGGFVRKGEFIDKLQQNMTCSSCK